MYTNTPVTPFTEEHGELLVRRVRLSPEETGELAPAYLHLVAWKGRSDSWINALELEVPDEARITQMVDSDAGRHMLSRMAVIAGSSWKMFESDPATFLEYNQFCVDTLGVDGVEELMGMDLEEVASIRLLEAARAPQPPMPALVVV